MSQRLHHGSQAALGDHRGRVWQHRAMRHEPLQHDVVRGLEPRVTERGTERHQSAYGKTRQRGKDPWHERRLSLCERTEAHQDEWASIRCRPDRPRGRGRPELIERSPDQTDVGRESFWRIEHRAGQHQDPLRGRVLIGIVADGAQTKACARAIQERQGITSMNAPADPTAADITELCSPRYRHVTSRGPTAGGRARRRDRRCVPGRRWGRGRTPPPPGLRRD